MTAPCVVGTSGVGIRQCCLTDSGGDAEARPRVLLRACTDRGVRPGDLPNIFIRPAVRAQVPRAAPPRRLGRERAMTCSRVGAGAGGRAPLTRRSAGRPRASSPSGSRTPRRPRRSRRPASACAAASGSPRTRTPCSTPSSTPRATRSASAGPARARPRPATPAPTGARTAACRPRPRRRGTRARTRSR